LHRFEDIAGFLCSCVTPPMFHPNFRGVPVPPDRPWWGQPARKLFGREIIFVPMWSRYLNVTDRQTDRPTIYTVA